MRRAKHNASFQLTPVLSEGETDQLIPSNSVFVLTTDVNLVPSSSSDLGLTNYVNERYFDKPEVIRSYREQQEIQTPEYTQLQDDALVGGRLRARGEVVSATVILLGTLPDMVDRMPRNCRMRLTRRDIVSTKRLRDDSDSGRRKNYNTNTTS